MVRSFPLLSETFILSHITGLLDRGHEVEIYAKKRADTSVVHDDVRAYELLEKTRFSPPIPTSRIGRFAVGTKYLLSSLISDPGAALRFMNVSRRGRAAPSLRLAISASPYWNRPPYDIVHCHFGPVGLAAVKMRELGLLKGRLVTTFHGFDASRFLEEHDPSVYAPLFAASDAILPVSFHIRQRLIAIGGDDRRIQVHRVGIDCGRFTTRERPSREIFRIVSVGRLVEKKGIAYAIRAVAKLVKKGRRIEYAIVGDGPLRDELSRLVHELGVQHEVELRGAMTQDQVVEALEASDILLGPSVTAADGDEEGVPTVFMEAMATGMPVVATKHAGIPELVVDGVSGYLAPERDVDTLADRIDRLISGAEARVQMGRAARAHVEREHNVEILNRKLVELYHELLRSPPVATG